MSWLHGKGSTSSSRRGKKKKSSTATSSTATSNTATSNTTTPSDQKLREAKSAPYEHPSYAILLETKGSFMGESGLDITDASKSLCQTLLEREPNVPQDSLFRDDLFHAACQMVQDRNEAKVVQDITRLIVPSAETLAIYSATDLQHLTESINEGWNNSIPVTKPRPQPDYSVGFRRRAFTEDQLNRLEHLVGPAGGIMNDSYYMATYYMYFPFLTCEVKCGTVGLDIADRQNAHSMTLAVRGIIELFKYVGREKELHREILAFSISHDHESVRIYGHYPVIDGNKTSFYRHIIRKFNFTESNGKDKWAAYKFTKNVYEHWMPNHFQRICSAIDGLQLPGSSGPSHEVEDHRDSNTVGSPDTTANASVSQRTESRGFRKFLRINPPKWPH